MASAAVLPPDVFRLLHEGLVIPAHPLALDADRRLDPERQKDLSRYYLAAGAGGLAVGVHTTQFAIREHGLLEPVLKLAKEAIDEAGRPAVAVAGACGRTDQALREAELAASLGYDLALVSPGGWRDADEEDFLRHVERIGEILPVFGFYLQPSVGGRVFSFDFWRSLADLEAVAAIKIAPFNRYQTIDVVRAVCASPRRDRIALYTGNDDNIIADLLTTFRFDVDGVMVEKRIVGGLLGQWAVWTERAVALLAEVKQALASNDGTAMQRVLTLNAQLTDANAAFFDVPNAFHGCIAGIHDGLRRTGLLDGIWCLDPNESLSSGQLAEIDRVWSAYPDLNDEAFVAAHRSHRIPAAR
jgi:dihydrodipicolinate synthase/N-acetylneuraminate lyase